MGFEFAYNDKVKDASSEYLYTSLNAWEEDNQNYRTYVPQDLCVVANYFKACTLRNVPTDQFNTPIDVVAYWVTLDGTKVYGKQATKRLYEGIEDLTSPEAYGYKEVTVDDLEGKYLNADVILPNNGNEPGPNGTRLSFASNDQGGWLGVRVFIQNDKLCVKDTQRSYDLEQYGVRAGQRFNLKLSIKDINTTNNTCTVGVWINNMFAGCAFETYTERQLGNVLAVASVTGCGTIMIGRPTK